MLSIRPALEIIKADLDREQRLVSVEAEDSKIVVTKKDLNVTEPKGRKKDKRRNCDANYNIFQMQDSDSEVVKLFKKIVKLIFLPAIVVVGIRANYNWKPQNHFMSLFTLCAIAFGWICVCYTHYLHAMHGEVIRNLEVFGIYGIALSGTMKFLNYIRQSKKVLALLHFMLTICRQNSIGARAEILKNELQKCFSGLKIFTTCIIANLVLFVSVPIVYYFKKKELISLIPLEIPLIDQSTLHGYLTANGVMSVNGLLITVNVTFCATLFIFLISNYSIQVELIGDDFKQLDRMWANKNESLSYRRAFLRNICVRCQDVNSYISEIKSIYDLKMFAYFTAAYISQIICLFEIAKINWIPGYAVAFTSFQEIMVYCYIGTKKSTANERLCNIISSTNWYEYDLLSQKVILSLLQSCQNASELEIGPLAPMNLSTGVQIIKSIYSYYTILTELL